MPEGIRRSLPAINFVITLDIFRKLSYYKNVSWNGKTKIGHGISVKGAVTYRIAVVEDDKREADELSAFIERYFRERQAEVIVTVFGDAERFLWHESALFDLVFLDIELPGRNGMEAARELRKTNSETVIVFVTYMAQFAMTGYEVDATDFIVKPVDYPSFVLKMSRVSDLLAGRQGGSLSFATPQSGMRRIWVREVRYAEAVGHKIVFHLAGGRTLETGGSLKNLQQRLDPNTFVRCNSCYLVNLQYVMSVSGYTVDVDGEKLQISRARRKDFMKAVSGYFGLGGGDK